MLVWRNANEPEATAVGAHGSRARKIICVEWFGDGPLPEPKWLTGSRHRELSEPEWRSIDEAIRRRVERHPDKSEPNMRDRDRIVQMSDNDFCIRSSE